MPPLDTAPPANPAAVPQTGGRETPPPATPPAALDAPPGLEAIARAFSHRWKLILTVGGIALVFGLALGWFFTPDRYIAQGFISLKNRGSREESESEFLNYQRTQITLLKSHSLLKRLLQIPSVADQPEVQAQGDLEDAILWLQKELVIEPVLNNPSVLRVSLSGRRAEELAVIVNNLMDVYEKDNKEREEVQIRKRIGQLNENLKTVTTKLGDDRLKLAEQMRKERVEDPALHASNIQALELRLSPDRSQMILMEVEMRTHELRLKEIQSQLANPDTIEVSDTELQNGLNQDPDYPSLLKQRKEILDSLNAALAAANPAQHPEIRDAYSRTLKPKEVELKEKETQVRERLRQKERDSLRIEKKKTEFQVVARQVQLKDLKEKMAPDVSKLEQLRAMSLPGAKFSPEIEKWRDQVTQGETQQKRLAEEIASLRADLTTVGRAGVLEAAQTPTEKKIDKKLKVAGGLGLSLFGLTFLGIAWVEFRMRRIYTQDDVTRGLGLPVVGSLPTTPEGARQPLPGADGHFLPEQGPLMESADAIRTVLMRAAQTDGVRIVLVTSAGGGEGKTSLACHLAASLARSWRNTLLIDADLRHPAAHAQFRLPVSPGFSEVLRNEATPAEVIRPTPLSRLSLLSAGKCDALTIQALAQERVGEILTKLKSEYDFVIIDVSPVLPVADAMLIGQHADGVLLTVLKDVSRMPAVYAAQQRLAALGIPMLGAVVIGEKVNTYGINPYPLRIQA